jgi:hypothetical protein
MKSIGFKVYIIFFVLLALFINRDILFNGLNYGRHWDWTFYPHPDFYKNYLLSFFSSLKPNSLGYFDVVSTPFSEFLIKGAIYSVFQLSQLLQLPQVTIPILNKVMVFVVIPTLSSIGVWKLAEKILKNNTKEDRLTFLVTVFFANLLYTFSLTLLFDMHGGALNRLISSFVTPWFFYFYYSYITEQRVRPSLSALLKMSSCMFFFDLASIFFFAILGIIGITLKKQSTKTKSIHLLTFGLLSLLQNAYWLHAFFLGDTISFSSILSERKADLSPLMYFSSKYLELFFPFNAPHDLVRRVFKNYFFVYLPYLTLFLMSFYMLLKTRLSSEHKNRMAILGTGFLVISLLVNGYYSLMKIQFALYQIPILGFIKGAQRYVPTAIGYIVFFFLCIRSVSGKPSRIQKYGMFFVSVYYIGFLLIHPPIVTQVVNEIIPDGYLNQDVGSTYKYDSGNYDIVKREQLDFNILPIPSWFSPYFTNNSFPKTSQGSNTENIFFGKGMLYTNGVSLFSSDFFNQFHSTPSPIFYGLANIRYVMFTPAEAPLNNAENNFTKDWVESTLPEEKDLIAKKYESNSLYKIPDKYFYPKIYFPQNIITGSDAQQDVAKLMSYAAENETIAGVVQQQNENELSELSKIKVSKKYSNIQYRKLSPSKYIIKADTDKESFMLVVSTAFYKGWRLTPKVPSIESVNQNTKFISDSHYGTTQNNNLPETETSLQDKVLPEKNHFFVNGYANGWLIRPRDICRQRAYCKNNSDGTVSMEFVAEFMPQRLYVQMLTLSILTGIILLVVIVKIKNDE